MRPNSPKESRTPSLGPTQPIPKKSLQIRTDKPRPHVCSICTRGFARLEHLKRHERSHTNEKPFQCAACGRCFARRDLVLRHQQKLHLHGLVRRSLVTSASSQNGLLETLTPNENIIILANNTNAKVPLPHLLLLSPNFGSGTHNLDLSSPLPGHEYGNSRNLGHNSVGAVLSPNTNSAMNTPQGLLRLAARANSALDPSLTGPVRLFSVTQQPSPLTGDSPDAKDKKKTWDADEFRQHRHQSFSAVSGLSYTNLKEAMSIQSHQIPDAPQQVGFATPQLTAAELDTKGLLVTDFGGLDLDWYNLDLHGSPHFSGSNGLAHGIGTANIITNGMNGVSTTITNGMSTNGINNGANNGINTNGTNSVLKKELPRARLDTIPSEPLLAGKDLELSYFSNQIMAAHHFHNPDHPHHIEGTTPLDFNMSPSEVQHMIDSRPMGTSFVDFAADMVKIANKDKATKAPKKRKLSSISLNKTKRTKEGFVNDTENLAWVEDIMSIPMFDQLPSASHDTGFVGLPYIADQYEPDEILSLFKLRQDDIVKQRSLVNTQDALLPPTKASAALTRSTSSRALFTIGDAPTSFITEEVRDKILSISKIASSQFPPLEDLNSYMALYENEFNIYYPFIHMPMLRRPKVKFAENIPLVLAMCAIGALYSYHNSNTLLLFNLSRYHINSFFEKEVRIDKLQFRKVPLMAHQTLVLHIFISMFLNEPNMVQITSTEINLMVGLIKSTNFHRPLEQFLVPPHPISKDNDVRDIQDNYDYFIMVQTRIRTIHCFYQLQVFRSALIGSPLAMRGSEIKTGTQCADEILWKADNAREWFSEFSKCPKKNLVELSNGDSMSDLFHHLNEHTPIESKLTFNKLFSLLMQVHEQILVEFSAQNLKGGFEPLSWRVTARPQLENLVEAWEVQFAKNGGFTVVNDNNNHLLNTNKELKLILPMLSFAKIRLCLNFTPVMEKVLNKDWKGMESMLILLDKDVDGLKEATKHAADILKLWVHNISVLNDSKQTSVRTPVFFVTCVFISVMVLAKTLHVIENGKDLSTYDKSIWLNCEQVFRNIEITLKPNDESHSYKEILQQSHGVFDYVWNESFKRSVENVRNSVNVGTTPSTLGAMKTCRFLLQALSLGVRILADAPLWPLAMGFAEALKNMAIQINGS